MRVVLVTNGLGFGGAERVVEAIALDLHRRGDPVHVIATTRDGPIGDSLRREGVPVSVLGIRHALDARVAWALARVARAHETEIIHSHLAVSDMVTALARTFVPRARTLSTIHSGYLDLGRWKTAVWKTSLRRFDALLAVSEPVKRLLPGDLAVEILRPSLVEGSAPFPSRGDARARLGIDPTTPLVIAVGRLVPVKGFDVLARAAKALTTGARGGREAPRAGARFLVIGEGPERARLESQGGLELLGSSGDAAGLLAAADVVVSASRSEGFPQSPLHAMAAGVPVVATAVGGTPEIVVHGETGLLVPPDDAGALADAIGALLRDPERARRMGDAGRARLSREGLTRESMLERTRAIYRTLIGSA